MPATSYRFRPTRGGAFLFALAALVGTAAYNGDINLLFLICATALGALLVSAVLPAFILRRLRVRRVLPYEAYAGELFSVGLRVANAGRGPTPPVLAEDVLHVDGGLLRTRACVDELPPLQSAGTAYQASAPRRGVYTCAGLRLTSRFPFGLAEVSRLFPERDELLVFPERVRLRRDFLAAVRRSACAEGAIARRSSGEEEYRSLREFLPGDNPRHIHWRTTARMRKLFVREMERDRERALLVLLDTHVPDPGREQAQALERALSFTAEFVRAAVAAGGVVCLAAYAPDLLVVGPMSDVRGVHDMLVALARLRPTTRRSVDQLAREPAVELRAALRRAAVLLNASALERLRGAVGGVAVEAYVVGSPAFERAIEASGRARPEVVAP